MSAGTGNNHTPLNVNNLFDRYTKPQFASLGKNQAEQTHSNLPNLFLVFAVLLFVGAFSFNLTQSQTSTNTRASALQTANKTSATLNARIAGFTNLEELKEYPTQYKGQTIPSSIFTDGEKKYENVTNKNNVKSYLIETVAKYYIYNDVLTEKGIINNNQSSEPTFAIIEDKIELLEKQVKENVVSSIDFAFIKAMQVTDNNDFRNQIESTYGSNLNNKANELVTKYREMLINGESIDTVLAAVKTDKELNLINNNEINTKILHYSRDDDFIRNNQNLKFKDNNFHNFLFSQTENQVSEVYEMGDSQKKYLYMIVYPLKVRQNEVETLNELYKQKLDLFK